MDKFDFAKWKPVSHNQFTELVAELYQNSQQFGVTVVVEDLGKDGRFRVNFITEVKHDVCESDQEPYLSLLCGPESTTVAFVRTDVYLP